MSKGAWGNLLRAFALTCLAIPSAASIQNGFDLSNATIPRSEIFPGGPPRDGIPSIDQPRFVKAREVDFLQDDARVLSVKIGNEVRAYPVRILNSHEIVNDAIDDQPVAVTYCPLAGAAIAFDRRVNGRTLSFGVSGLLYQSDLVMYDRQTESLWPQVAMKAVSGPQVGTSLRWLPSEDMSWRAWHEAYPDGKVLSPETDEDLSNPYGSYERSNETKFPIKWSRPELPKKSWVIGVIINAHAKAYALEELRKQTRLQDNVAGQQIEITYDAAKRSAAIINKDNGAPVPFTLAYWFAWQAFYPKTELFGH